MASHRSMPVIIPATKAHRKFGDLVRRVFSGQEHFIVEKDGLPVMAIISMAEYEELMKERERREQRVQRFREVTREMGEDLQRRGITEEQAMEELEKTKKQVYQERYGDNQ